MAFGRFRANINAINNEKPIQNAKIRIYDENSDNTPIEELTTDANGQTNEIELEAPDTEYSLEPSAIRPYSVYAVEVEAQGYEKVYINGSEILSDVTAVQNVSLFPIVSESTAETFVIPDHTLYGDYPPKISENEIKDVSETGEIVLSRVVIPEYIVVHDGPPTDTSARNYYVKYKDYIKNVASSEIYATWPESTIQANVLAIMSFTLNRVYTEWYRNRGYDFTITNSTAFDQKWINGRNIFDTISNVVDSIFSNYLSRPSITQPLFTQYCDGKRVTCPRWLSQWGSKELGDQNYSAIDILRYYYGDTIYINSTDAISGVPSSWPGYDLNIGTSGNKVLQLQQQLNVVAGSYPLIPRVVEDGVYGQATSNSINVFQRIFGLSQTGVTDFATWYKLSEIYVGVSKIAEYI